MVGNSQSHNPYVGPRPFEREEKNLFFGREREISELQSLLTAHRTLLLYAASGAGKTSLLNAGLLPLMEQEGFEVLPIARVRGLIPGGVRPEDISNLYVFNTLMGWTEDEAAHKTLPRMSLAEFLKTREHILDSEGFSAPRLIIFDQFEELFTLYQEHWKQRADFFHQVAEALEQDPVLRVLFVMREDYLASLDPYVSLLPERLRARYRLVRLRFEDACQAVEGPLKGSERSFADGVAARLVGELLKTKVQSVTGETVEAVGEYVEPVQLQIVCRNLWDSLPAEVTVITSGHLRSFGDVDEALKGFYENAVQKTISETDVKEEELRKWFAQELITPAGTRGTVYRGKEDTDGIPNAAVDILENEHILRGELRAGAHWYELTHDRLIEPIRNSNETWLSDFEVEQARLRARKKLRRFLYVGVAGFLVLLFVTTIVSIRIYCQRKIDTIFQQTPVLQEAAKGGLTDQQLRQLSSLIDLAQTLKPAAQIVKMGPRLEEVVSPLRALILIPQNTAILKEMIGEIFSEASALQESAKKGKLTKQDLRKLSTSIDLAQTLRPAAQIVEMGPQLDEVLGRLNMMGASKL